MNVLKPLIEQLSTIVKEGYDLGKKELPEIAKQIIRYSFWSNILGAIVSLTFTTAFAYFAYGMYYLIQNNPHTASVFDSCDGLWMGLFLLGALSCGGLIGVICFLDGVLKIVLAPKVFILDILKSYL